MINPTLLLVSLLALPQAADEQYQFILGLADKGMHSLVISEATEFLRKNPRHPKLDEIRYRLAAAQFETGDFSAATVQLRGLAQRAGFEYEAEANFRLGQCELAEKKFDASIDAFDNVLRLGKQSPGKKYLAIPATYLAGDAAFQKGDHAEAARRYRAVLEGEPNGDHSRDARYGLAWAEFRQGNHAEAITVIDAFLTRHRNDELAPELSFLKGEALFESGNPSEARRWYGAVDAGPFRDAALRGVGFSAAAEKDARGAIDAFQTLLKEFPTGRFTREATLQCAIQQLQANLAADAVATLSRPIANKDAELLYWRAQARSKVGDAEKALADVEAALATRPDSSLGERLQIARGDLLSDLGRTEEAARAYTNSNSDYAVHAAAVASLNDGRLPEARRLAEQFVTQFPDSSYLPATRHLLGECLLAAGDSKGAAKEFEAAASGTTDRGAAIRSIGRLGWASYLAGDLKKAAACFGRVADDGVDDDRAEACYMLGRSLADDQQADAAIRAWDRYLADYAGGKNEPEVLLALSRAAPDRAPELLDRLLKKHRDHESVPAALFDLAESKQREGDPGSAIRLYKQLLERFPDHSIAAAARYGLAWCHYEASDYRSATPLLEGILSSGGTDPTLEASAAELLVFAAAKGNDAPLAKGAFERLRSLVDDDDRLLGPARAAAQALADAGRPDDADQLLADWQRSRRTSSPALLIERGWLALDQHKSDHAEALVAEARKALGRDADAKLAEAAAELAFFVGEALFDAKEDARAVALYDFAAGTAGSGVVDKALYKSGFARLRNDDLKGAANRFQTLVDQAQKSPLFGESLFLLGECQYRQDDLAAAIVTLQRLCVEAPRHDVIPKGMFRLGIALAKMNEFERAVPILTDLARRFPKFDNLMEAELWRGRSLVATENARGARQAFDRVVATDRGALAAQARLEIGRLQFDAGDTEKALAEFLKVAVLYADADAVSEGLFLAGRCLEKIGDPDRAKAQYQEVVTKYPKSAFANEARKRLSEI